VSLHPELVAEPASHPLRSTLPVRLGVGRSLDLVPHVAGGESEDDEEGDERPEVFGLDDREEVGPEGEEGKGEGGDAVWV
jgi:hypothetical protein